jgi:hypothetical protein
MTLQSTEAECAAVATAPRVSLADIEKAILHRYDLTGDQIAVRRLKAGTPIAKAEIVEGSPLEPVGHPALRVLSVCLLVLNNGFTVIGKSAPASPENFNAELGRKLAYEDCIRQLWPLMGYNLRQKLHESGT